MAINQDIIGAPCKHGGIAALCRECLTEHLQQQNDKLTADNAALVEALEAMVKRHNEENMGNYGELDLAEEALEKAKGDV